MFYHGSSVKGLKTLVPSVSEHEESYVYFATDPVVATFYMVNIVERPYYWFTYGFDKSGIPKYTEYYPNAMAEVYSGKTGYIYECSKVDDVENPTNINCAFVCKKPVKIDKCIEVKDVYEKLLEYEKEGKLIIQRYETLSQKMFSFINTTIRSQIEENNLKDNSDSNYSLFLRKHFPKIWDNEQ